MSKPNSTVMEETMKDNFPWTAETIASELDMPLSSFRVWKNKMEKDGKLKRPQVNSLFCIQDPESKNRLLYSAAYLDKLKEIRDGNVKRSRRSVESSMKHAILKIVIPIFDKNVADYIIRKFKDEKGLEEHLKNHIKDMALPVLSKLEELKRRHAEELEQALQETASL